MGFSLQSANVCACVWGGVDVRQNKKHVDGCIGVYVDVGRRRRTKRSGMRFITNPTADCWTRVDVTKTNRMRFITTLLLTVGVTWG